MGESDSEQAIEIAIRRPQKPAVKSKRIHKKTLDKLNACVSKAVLREMEAEEQAQQVRPIVQIQNEIERILPSNVQKITVVHQIKQRKKVVFDKFLPLMSLADGKRKPVSMLRKYSKRVIV